MIVKELGLEFVTRVKKNTGLVYEGKKLQAHAIGTRLLKGTRPYRIRFCGTRARSAVACACIAAVVLDHVRQGADMSPCQTKQLRQRLVFVDTADQKLRLALLHPTAAETLEELDEAKKAVRRQLFRVTGQRLKRPVSLLIQD